jgi:hypothetical protein
VHVCRCRLAACNVIYVQAHPAEAQRVVLAMLQRRFLGSLEQLGLRPTVHIVQVRAHAATTARCCEEDGSSQLAMPEPCCFCRQQFGSGGVSAAKSVPTVLLLNCAVLQ